jgi:putative SOS response-associated peptidase YedK
MCGRFENTTSLQMIFEFLEREPEDAELKNLTNTNIAPTNKIAAVLNEGGKYKVIPMNWGIKFGDKTPLIFNSRIETIKEKPYWQKLFDTSRCLVPMSAFYEWKSDGSRKVPYRIFLPDEKFFFVPALYLKKENEYFASLITTTPNKIIQKIHHRMPVIFKPGDALEYLTAEAEQNLNRCIPFSDNEKMGMERAFF